VITINEDQMSLSNAHKVMACIVCVTETCTKSLNTNHKHSL